MKNRIHLGHTDTSSLLKKIGKWSSDSMQLRYINIK